MYHKIETLNEKELKKYQLEQINKILSAVKHTPYYAGKLPEYIDSFDTFAKIPFLTKKDLRDAFPYGLLSCPKEKLVRISASSGMTGIPTLSYCSEYDLNEYTKNEMLHLSHTGLCKNDIIQCMMGFNLFTGGWGCYHGSIGLGATVIPSGPGNTQRQIELLKQLKARYCFSTPGYLQHLLGNISDKDWEQMNLKIAMTGGEPLTKEFQKLAKEKYDIEIYNFYGMTEFSTHIASECNLHNGLHINENYFYAEIVDPETGDILPDGEYGELILTNLKREAMPLIRYKTRDITRIIPDKCICGRTSRRIEPISHRLDDMLIINGVNIYPSQIEECIFKCFSSVTNYLIKINTKNAIKKLNIDIEIPDDIINNENKINKLKEKLIKTLKSYITITPALNFVPKHTLPEIQGKTKRVKYI